MDNPISLDDWIPMEAKRELARLAKETRLARGWKRETLSDKTGIPVSTLKRYETTGEIGLQQFLKLVFVIGDINRLKSVFEPEKPVYVSLDELIKDREKPKRKRGSK
jgi:transcriptional regulator with XRE-family HTH domain